MNKSSKIKTILTLSFILYGSVACAKTTYMPKELRGVWYEHNSQGREQCKVYRQDKSIDNQIGALIIRKNNYDTYAEYGEGNHAVPTRVRPLGTRRWWIQDMTYLDGSSEGILDDSIFAIKKTLLHWTYSYRDEGKKVKHTKILFKCL